MSVSEMYCKMMDEYVELCWLRYHTVAEVKQAIDEFISNLKGENTPEEEAAKSTSY